MSARRKRVAHLRDRWGHKTLCGLKVPVSGWGHQDKGVCARCRKAEKTGWLIGWDADGWAIRYSGTSASPNTGTLRWSYITKAAL